MAYVSYVLRLILAVITVRLSPLVAPVIGIRAMCFLLHAAISPLPLDTITRLAMLCHVILPLIVPHALTLPTTAQPASVSIYKAIYAWLPVCQDSWA